MCSWMHNVSREMLLDMVMNVRTEVPMTVSREVMKEVIME